MLNDWIEKGSNPWLNECFLEYRQVGRSPYCGVFGEATENSIFQNSTECIEKVLSKLLGHS